MYRASNCLATSMPVAANSAPAQAWLRRTGVFGT